MRMNSTLNIFGFEIVQEQGKSTIISLASMEELKITRVSAQADKDAAFMLASYADHKDAFKYLLMCGANPTYTDQSIDEYIGVLVQQKAENQIPEISNKSASPTTVGSPDSSHLFKVIRRELPEACGLAHPFEFN